MVRRILENRHYAGDEEYPAIVTCAVFEQANEKRLRKGGDRETDSEQEKYFKSHTVCEQCDGRFTRRRNWSQTHGTLKTSRQLGGMCWRAAKDF